MKKALLIVSVLVVAVISTACINNIAVQELNNKAAEYMQKGDYVEAMNRLQASLDIDSTLYETYYNLGVAAINAQKYEKAIEALESGIKIKPDFANFYYSLGYAQTSYADVIIDQKDVNSSAEEANNLQEVKAENKEKAIELKRIANENLKKYLTMSPSAKDKEIVEALIEENDAYIKSNEIVETVVE